MKLDVQKRIAGDISKCSPKRVRFDTENLSEIKEAITKKDIGNLISQGIIKILPARSPSRARARKIHIQKTKGKQKGHGSRKGKKTTRGFNKETWMNKIRLQRELLKKLRDKSMIDRKTYRMLYLRAKGGFFRNLRHLKLYIEENKLIIKK